MERSQVIDNIRQVAASVLPKGSTLYLYGSRARGDYHENSDWDLLVLLDKPKKEKSPGTSRRKRKKLELSAAQGTEQPQDRNEGGTAE